MSYAFIPGRKLFENALGYSAAHLEAEDFVLGALRGRLTLGRSWHLQTMFKSHKIAS